MIAYKTGPLPNGGWDVTLVPATGGAERVVAEPQRGFVLALPGAPDGKSLYLERDDR